MICGDRIRFSWMGDDPAIPSEGRYMEFIAKLVLMQDGKSFFGPGVRDLFVNIESERSVKAAAEKMGMSYSKAWKMIREVDKALGHPSVERIQGGHDGGSAKLTCKGSELLERYISFEKESKARIKEVFEDTMGE